jgi:hypothetical protein
MKLKKGSDRWLYGNMRTESVVVCVGFYPFIVSFEFIECLPYSRRAVTIRSDGIEKFRIGRGQPNYWMRSIFEMLEENQGGGTSDEIV